MILRGGYNVYGIPIGILCLESYCANVPGHIRNATTFNFPVYYKVVYGATPKKVVDEADGALLERFIGAARELEREGVRAITTSCGFMVLFQKELADSVSVPVYTSSLIQIPMVSRMIGSDQKVGILTAKRSRLTGEHLRAVGADSTSSCIAGMDEQKEFCEVIIDQKRTELDIMRLEKEVLSVVDKLIDKHPEIGALVIECTDLTSFAHLIQQKAKVPVFDIITLTNMVYETVVRKSYQGIMPH
jgi:aspartate/glutamate racemase